MGNLGFTEMMLILIIALIIFGPKKLPEIGKTIGKGLAEFRRASNELRNTWEEEVRLEELKKYEKMVDPFDNQPYQTPDTGGYNAAGTGANTPTPTGAGAAPPAAEAPPAATGAAPPASKNEPGKA